MGLLYNNKKKSDLVVLDERELENAEGEDYGFELIPDVEEKPEPETDDSDEKKD